jgi:inosose dehydratase
VTERTPPRSLARSPIGVVPIVWNNADLADLAPRLPASVVLDEAERLGFEGVQDGVGFPSGSALRQELTQRHLRLAETYAALPCAPDGPAPDALQVGRERLADLHRAGGEVLVVALAVTLDRSVWAGRATAAETPRLSDAGWSGLVSVLETLGREARELGHPLAFHGHTGTFVETLAELDRLVASTDPELVPLCLDVGHCIVGGGDPVVAIRRYGPRIAHVHLKDVAAEPLTRLRDGTISGFTDALRARIFTELGDGVLDVAGVLDALDDLDYRGWLMVEQDTTWKPPSESAAIGRSVLGFALRLRAEGRRAA